MVINEKTRADVASRLKRYCLSEDDVAAGDLVVPCRTVVRLSSAPSQSSARAPHILSTEDLDELKSWIGVPDGKSKRAGCSVERDHANEMKELRGLASEVKAASVGERRTAFLDRMRATKNPALKFDSLRSHAREYLYGDSKTVASAKPVLEAAFAPFQIAHWPILFNVKVSSGSTLVFGPGANVLTANELEIEQGGRIVSHGSLTVNISTLRKTQPFVVHTPIDISELFIPRRFA